ncbi:MAG: UDP-N-acetylglucosamine 2-epimerase (non-hydrolyzing) [Sulfurovum sp.]|nr:UDP-N-acetylglucosamine 2-epimerase (non-hydrolyzing) [Sulfurovum sp.]
MIKILTILGARPQFIKAGTVSREIAKYDEIDEIIVHTGQHYDANMSDIFFDEMQIPKPDYHLDINGLGHGAMTGQMLEAIEKVLIDEKPDWVMVYGDTNSTLAGALAASKLHIKLAHIEAGLRSFNMKMPEEVNRILTDRVSDLLFCPTDSAIGNLKNEGFDQFACKVVKSGDVMQDGAMFYRHLAKKPDFDIANDYILSTIHRAENTDDIVRLTSIIESLNTLNKEKQVIVPLHPRTRKIIEVNSIKTEFTMIAPVGYLEMVWLIDHCDIVLTDSGGLQKEAFFFQKPCITLRDETEWVELIENRFNVLAGADKDKILDVYKNFDFSDNFSVDLYGRGLASSCIMQELLKENI